jgi:hypothetical protein
MLARLANAVPVVMKNWIGVFGTRLTIGTPLLIASKEQIAKLTCSRSELSRA